MFGITATSGIIANTGTLSTKEDSSTNIVELQDYDETRCRWRTCRYQGGVLLGCSPWVYGDCTVNADGSIDHE